MSDSKPAPKTPKKKTPAKKTPPAPEVVEAPKLNPHYTVGEWHELPHYQCSRCSWSTLNEDEMIEHVADHLKLPAVRRTDTGFVNESGAKIIREEIMPPGEE